VTSFLKAKAFLRYHQPGGKIMAARESFIDPFDAPEFRVSGVAWREMVSTDTVRSVFFVREGNEGILKVKLLIPIAVMAAEHDRAREFVMAQTRAAAETWSGLCVPPLLLM
jgi:hypothetical protein